MARKQTSIPPLIGGSRPVIKNPAALFVGVIIAGGILIALYLTYSVPDTRPDFSDIVVSTEQKDEQMEDIKGEKQTGEISAESDIREELLETVVAWRPNDLVLGQITGDSYEVKYQDTLWEIAEAKYGSGFSWEIIRRANIEKIDFLPNGSQALIYPGQVLTLPEIKL
jgi:hypothetical protein